MQKYNIVSEFSCTVMEVISGDDLILMVDLGIDDLYKRIRARLMGVDTPDAYRKSGDGAAGKVREEVRKLTKGRPCRIMVHEKLRGGWIVRLYINVGRDKPELDLNEYLISQGHIFVAKEKIDGVHTETQTA